MHGDGDYLKRIAGYRIPVEGLPLFVELPGFRARWARLGLEDAALHVLQMAIADRPTAGAVVAGTNGVRKVRFAAPGENVGKSGAYRVFYYPDAEHGVVVLMSVLAKNEETNLSKAQRNALAGVVAELRAELKKWSRS
jgi:hypothetical protein